MRIDPDAKTITLAQHSDENVVAVVISFCDSTRFFLDAKPASTASLKVGMNATIEMCGQKMVQLTAETPR